MTTEQKTEVKDTRVSHEAHQAMLDSHKRIKADKREDHNHPRRKMKHTTLSLK